MTRELANKVAKAMMDWATEHGATHYCHWFQPLTGGTAEKHDAFLDYDNKLHYTLKFSGNSLIKGEADASSLPNGSIRSTFEARGYTIWDSSSQAFIKDNGKMKVLYIPTAFCAYNGLVLDEKTPVLRSVEALNSQAIRVLRHLGDTKSQYINSYVGPEQEYFLIDAKDFERREDLKECGRTLFGNPPAKCQ